MSTSTETLVIELDARTAKLQTELERTDKKLDDLTKSATNADKSLGLMSKAGDIAGAAITAVGTAGAAAGAAILAASQAAAEYARTLEIASFRSKESVENLQEMAYATKTVGIDLDKLGDISKDTLERVGEYLNEGTGEFLTMANALGLTTEQTDDLAIAMSYMSGPQALQHVVTEMQSLGKGTVEISAAMESLASDTTDLIPLLLDGGAAMKELREEARQNIKILTDKDLNNIKQVSEEMNNITAAAAADSHKLVSVMSDDITSVLETLSGATGLIGESIIWAINGVQMLTTKTVGSVMNLTREAEEALLKMRITFNELTGDDEEASFLRGQLEALQALDLALDEFDVTYFNEQMAKAKEQIAEFRGALGAGEDGEEAMTAVVQQNVDAAAQVGDAWVSMYASRSNASGREVKSNKKDSKDKEKAEDSYYGNAKALAQEFAGENDIIRKALIVADTAAAITRSLSINPYDWVNPSLIAATGAVQLASVGSGSSGGSPGSGGSSSSSQQQNFQGDDVGEVQVSGTVVSEQGITESSQALVNMADPEDVAVIMGKWLQNAQENGRIA